MADPTALAVPKVEPPEAKVPEPSKSSSISDSFFSSLKSNPYFSAGFGLVGIGALLSILKKGSAVAYTLAQKNLTISLEIQSKDESYDWLLRWINQHLAKRAQHISVQTYFQKNQENERVSTFFQYVPSTGAHFFKYKGNWIRAERVREQMIDLNKKSPVETLKLVALGRDTSIFRSMLQEARQQVLQTQSGKTLIYLAGLGKQSYVF